MSTESGQVVDIQDRMYWSLSQLSSAFGPARETISKRLKQANVVSTRKRGQHDVFNIADAARAILAAEMPQGEGIVDGVVVDPDKLQPKDRLDWYKGENEKRKFLIESSQLVPVDEVVKEMAAVVKTCIRTLDTLPDILEMKCGLDHAAVLLVEAECDHAREDLAAQLESDE